MEVTADKNEKMGELIFSEIYPHYQNRIEKNGRSKEELVDEFELYRQCRQMEKLIDELAKGRKMEKVLRS